MAISVVCSGCKKRFKVSDKFAGRKGPCPNCKAIIAIPTKADEVVIHDPTKGAPGSATEDRRKISEPIFFEELKVGWMDYVGLGVSLAAWIGGLIAVRLAYPVPSAPAMSQTARAALANRSGARLPVAMPDVPWWVLAAGAIAIAVAVAILGYRFLRDRERGSLTMGQLPPRVVAVVAGLAAVWLVPLLLRTALAYEPNQPLAVYFVVVLGPAMVALATTVPLIAYEWLVGRAIGLGGLYLVMTLISRVILGLPAFG